MTVAADKEAVIASLREMAWRIRLRDLEMIYRAGIGHIGGDLSAIDIITTLYFATLRIDPRSPTDPERDRFVMSKGHCAGALYTTLAMRGFFPESDLRTFAQPMSALNGHPDRNKVPGVETNTGPLGHGLPVAVGAAIGGKLSRAQWRVFVLTGDGELQEGSNWEAAMTAGHRGLDSLTLIVDHNGLQQGDTIANIARLAPIARKFDAFGWATRDVDGHDPSALLDVFDALPLEAGKPSCIVAHTHKGKGVSFMEDQVVWHHRVPNAQEFERAKRELEAGRPS